MISVELDPAVRQLLLGVVQARGMSIGPATAELSEACREWVEKVRAAGPAGGEARREAVRALLRLGGFKPAGRNKPAQEYLARTVKEEGELPTILNAVDWLNAISLASGLPISLLGADRLSPGAVVRYGKPSEKFVFNRAGQELDLEGLLCVCVAGAEPPGAAPTGNSGAGAGGSSEPLGTPIKDSMAGKISEQDQEVVAVIYAPQAGCERAELTTWCDQLASGFQRYCGAGGAEVAVLISAT